MKRTTGILGRFGGVLLLFVIATACSGSINSKQRFDRTVHIFNDGLRWKRVNMVTSYMSIPESERYSLKQGEFSDDYRILDYEVQSIRPFPGEDKAVSIVRFSWLRLPANIVQKTVLEQHWVDRKGEWKLKEQKILRNGKSAPMPKSVPF